MIKYKLKQPAKASSKERCPVNLKKWEVAPLDRERAAQIAERYSLPFFLAMLLEIRGFAEEGEIRDLLSGGQLSDPFLMKDMDKAVERIHRAIEDFERIAVYGDYDADGVTATSILFTYLEAVGADVMYYIPQREGEGYGMNLHAVETLHQEGVTLIITVDNGIASVAEVDRARELVSREGNAFEQVVGRLEEARRKMEDELEALRASAAQAKANAEASQRLKDEAEAQAKKEIDRARQEAAQIVQKTRQRADALVGELEELRRQKNKQLSAEQKARLRSGLKELESSSDPVHQRRDDNYVLPRPLVVGDEVLLYDIDKEATVLELPKDGTVLVQAGIIKTRVPLGNVRLLSKRQLKKKNPTRTVTKNVSTPETSSSLDLRGQTVEEALMEVDNFLDRASRMHLSQVTIIHGKGTGALRTAVQQHLRRCSQVKSFRLGTYGEGESGVTIAELK